MYTMPSNTIQGICLWLGVIKDSTTVIIDYVNSPECWKWGCNLMITNPRCEHRYVCQIIVFAYTEITTYKHQSSSCQHCCNTGPQTVVHHATNTEATRWWWQAPPTYTCRGCACTKKLICITKWSNEKCKPVVTFMVSTRSNCNVNNQYET